MADENKEPIKVLEGTGTVEKQLKLFSEEQPEIILPAKKEERKPPEITSEYKSGYIQEKITQTRMDTFINEAVDKAIKEKIEEMKNNPIPEPVTQPPESPTTEDKIEITTDSIVLTANSQAELPVSVIEQPTLFPFIGDEPGDAWKPFEYQNDALNAIEDEPHSTIQAPTGSGKTLIGAMIIKEYGLPAVVITPQIAIMNQWIDTFKKAGTLGTTYFGEEKQISDLMVTTYQSASMKPDILSRFNTIIFDEVHHLYAPEFSKILEAVKDKQILVGLTATPLRPNDQNYEVQQQVLPVSFTLTPTGLADYGRALIPKWISTDTQSLRVSRFHNELQTRIKNIIRQFDRYGDWMSAVQKGNRVALAGMKMRSLDMKVLSGTLDKLMTATYVIARKLEQNPSSKVIVFTESGVSANDIGSLLMQLGIPTLVFLSEKKLDAEDKRRELKKLKDNVYQVLVGVNMIIEGLDVPEMDVAILVASSIKSERRFTQKIGRILRYREGKKPEIISMSYRGTGEMENVTTLMKQVLNKDNSDEIIEYDQSELDAMKQWMKDRIPEFDFDRDRVLEEVQTYLDRYKV